jgi:Ca2+-binding RTX toxin-like protein
VARTLLGGGYGCKGNDGDSDSASQNDAVVGVSQNDAVVGVSQNDAVVGVSQNDAVVGVSQNDAVVGVSQNDAVVGRGGMTRWWGEAEWRGGGARRSGDSKIWPSLEGGGRAEFAFVEGWDWLAPRFA